MFEIIKRTARKIIEEQDVVARNIELVRTIAQIQKLHGQVTAEKFPVKLETGIRTGEKQFHYVVVPCKDENEPRVDVNITLGVSEETEALLMIETYRKDHKPDDRPYETVTCVLGNDYIKRPAGERGDLIPTHTDSAHFKSYYQVVGEALDFVKKTVRHMGNTGKGGDGEFRA